MSECQEEQYGGMEIDDLVSCGMEVGGMEGVVHVCCCR